MTHPIDTAKILLLERNFLYDYSIYEREGKPLLANALEVPTSFAASARTGVTFPQTLQDTDISPVWAGVGLLLFAFIGAISIFRESRKVRWQYRAWSRADSEKISGLLLRQEELECELDKAYCSAGLYLKRFSWEYILGESAYKEVLEYVGMLLSRPFPAASKTLRGLYPGMLMNQPALKSLLETLDYAELCAYATKLLGGGNPEKVLLETMQKNGKYLRECVYEEVVALLGPEAAYQFRKLTEKVNSPSSGFTQALPETIECKETWEETVSEEFLDNQHKMLIEEMYEFNSGSEYEEPNLFKTLLDEAINPETPPEHP